MPGTPPPPATTPSQLDDGDFSEIERQRLRKLLLDQDRQDWAIRQLKILVPGLVAICVGAYQAWAWAVDHVNLKR